MDIAKALSLAKKAKVAGFSYYGLRNSKEFVAESIAQYFLAENPSEIAKEVASILKGK
uniref:Pro-Pro endopeptidase-1 n=1 Tax=Myoviridae sp. ctkOm7 TaxID=2826690 RepID=A0A8S5NNR2_9CAUD|nr:MAG TPA: Pro-Pro endopeptidase-1 [Myoviridae sp. ctkOm7]